jgi:DNA-binding NarL/FixJ family response regulator
MIADTNHKPRPRLIIADDDPVVQSILEMSLSGEFDVIGVASDSDEAIALAIEGQSEVAIVDVDMPKGGGLTAVRGILKVAPHTAIVVLSSDESDAGVRELMQAGAMTYQRKGVRHELLVQALNDSIIACANGRAERA